MACDEDYHPSRSSPFSIEAEREPPGIVDGRLTDPLPLEYNFFNGRSVFRSLRVKRSIG